MKGWTRADIDARKREGFTECNPSGVAASMRGLVVPPGGRLDVVAVNGCKATVTDFVLPVVRYVEPTKAQAINKTEAEYLARLTALKRAGEILEIYGHQSIKFQIGERCFYSPDFPVMTPTGLEMHEVKGGHVWEDGQIKFKAAATIYRFCRWVWAQKIHGEWRIER